MCIDCILASPTITQVDPGDDPFSRWFCHRGGCGGGGALAVAPRGLVGAAPR